MIHTILISRLSRINDSCTDYIHVLVHAIFIMCCCVMTHLCTQKLPNYSIQHILRTLWEQGNMYANEAYNTAQLVITNSSCHESLTS